MNYKSFKIRLELNNKQQTLAAKHAGIARYAYNWACNIYHDIFDKNYKIYEENLLNKDVVGFVPANYLKFPTAIDLHKLFVLEVKSKFEWIYESSKFSSQQSFRNIEKSIKNYFEKLKKGEIKKLKDNYANKKLKGGGKIDMTHLIDIGRSKFKKKGKKDSFYLEGSNIKVSGKYINLPKFGLLKMSETLEIDEKIKNVVISKKGEHWFVAFKIEVEKLNEPNENTKVVGVDLGIKTLAVLSDGKEFKGSNPFRKNKRKLAIAQRKLSKKFTDKTEQEKKDNLKYKPQSKNYEKQKKIVNKIHTKIGNIRKNEIHQLTSYLSKNHAEVVIEDLNVKGMTKNHKLASAILDKGFFEFRRQLTYKCEWNETQLTVVDRFYASSKICSCCGNKKEKLNLSERVYKCDVCGMQMDRDLNASLNLEKKAVRNTVNVEKNAACGELKNTIDYFDGNSVKQEDNIGFCTEMCKIV